MEASSGDAIVKAPFRHQHQHHLNVHRVAASPPNLTLNTASCASHPFHSSSAPFTQSATQPALLFTPIPPAHSAAPSTPAHSALRYSDLCPISPSWARSSDHPAVWQTTRTSLRASLRASGRPSFRQVRLSRSHRGRMWE